MNCPGECGAHDLRVGRETAFVNSSNGYAEAVYKIPERQRNHRTPSYSLILTQQFSCLNAELIKI